MSTKVTQKSSTMPQQQQPVWPPSPVQTPSLPLQPPALVTSPRIPRPQSLGLPLLPSRHSQREHHPPFHPGNIYGECREPSKQVKEIEQELIWKQLVGEEPPWAPDTLNVPGGLPPSPMLSEDDIDHLTREGGDSLVSFLCSRTISFVGLPMLPITRNGCTATSWNYLQMSKLSGRRLVNLSYQC